MPVCTRPRSRRAARTRVTPSTSCGVKLSATTTATPTSYSAPGTARSSRRGFANAFAAPTQASMVASCSPAYTAPSSPSRVTSPPSRTPAAQSGSVTSGRLTSTWPGTGAPTTIANTTRIATTTRPIRR